MGFAVFLRSSMDYSDPHADAPFTVHQYSDIDVYEVLPGGVLSIDIGGEGNMRIFAPGEWRWLTSDGHPPGEVSRDL